MTRLVGVRAVCDVCSAARAVLFCVVHRYVFCVPCDTTVHTDPAEATHQRVDLSCAVTALPFCEHCDKAPATSYCESEGTTLCDQCDITLHRNKPCAAREHRLISKALAQRTVSFTGLPPPSADEATAFTTNVRKTVAPHSPRGKSRRRSISSPMKRRSKRENMSQSSSEERNLLDVAARTQAARNRHAPSATAQHTNTMHQAQFPQHMQGVHPQQLTAQAVRNAQLTFRDASADAQTSIQQQQIPPSSMTHDNQLAYMQAMALMGHRGPVDFFATGLQPFFAPDMMTVPTDGNLMLDEGNAPSSATSRRYPTNIAPHPGMASSPPGALGRPPMSTHPEAASVAAAAAAAATAAGEMFLLSAASSDQPSGSSEGLPPTLSGFTSSPDAAGLATAATAAAESTVAAIGGQTIRPPMRASSPNELHTESFIAHSPNLEFEQQQQQRSLSKPLRRSRPNETDILDDNAVMVDIQRPHLFERTQQQQQFADPTTSDHGTHAQYVRHLDARQNRTDHHSTYHDGVTDLGGDDDDDVERDHYPLTDFDIPRDDFGVFDALDLSSFDHNGVSNFDISSERSTGCSLGDADHNS